MIKLKSFLIICIAFIMAFIGIKYPCYGEIINGNNLIYSKEMIPKIIKVEQINENKIEFSYDMPVDKAKGTSPNNYWIRYIVNIKPAGIASLGKNDKATNENSLTKDMVEITSKNESNKDFIMTFSKNISPGMTYRLIVYGITIPGNSDFSGSNGFLIFTTK